MRSTRAFRFNPTASTETLTHTFAAAIGSPATIVKRLYVYFASLPSADTRIWSAGGVVSVIFESSDSTLRAGGAATTNQAASGQVVTTGVWYRLDIKGVRNTTITCDLSVDGVAQTQYSVAGSAASITSEVIGIQDSCTADMYVDDMITSGTSGDFPIGAGTVAGLYPNGDRTSDGGGGQHVYDAVGDFGKGSGGGTNLAASNVESTSWQSLANPLSTSVATNFISDRLGGVAEHLVWTHDALPSATSVNGVMLVAATHSASATGNNQSAGVIAADNSATVAWANLDLSESTITVPIAVLATAPGGGAWDRTAVNNAFFYWGDSSDVNPDAFLDGILLEVDYVASGSAVAITGKGAISHAGRAQTELQARLTGRGGIAAGGNAATQLALALTGRGAVANTGTAATQLTLGLTGHGDIATAGTAFLTVEADNGDEIAITGYGAIASAGAAAIQLSLPVTGRGDNATDSRGAVQVLLDARGHGDTATAGRAATQLSLPVTGHGDVATAGTASARLSLPVTGHGDVAVDSDGAVLLTAVVRGHGDVAVDSDSAVQLALDLTGKGTIATAGRASAQLALDLAGRGAVSTAGSAQLTLAGRADFTGFGANSNTGRAATQLALALSGHADVSTTGNAAATLAVRLSGSGAVSTAGSAALSPVDSETAGQEPRFLPGPPARQRRIFRTRIQLRLTVISHYTPRPVLWSGALNVVVGGVTLIQPRHQQIHHRLEHRSRVREGCRRTKIYSGPIEARTAERRSYRRELLTVGPELLL